MYNNLHFIRKGRDIMSFEELSKEVPTSELEPIGIREELLSY